MKTLDTYFGIEPFTVVVDDSPPLRVLAERARQLRHLPFQDKLAAVKQLALDAMVNAYEQMIAQKEKAAESEEAQRAYERLRDIVFEKHPLRYALEQRAGCCRYQGALFFVLGYEAELGNRHFVHAAPVNSHFNTVFNEIVHDEHGHTVSIFTESLGNKSLDYSRANPRIFEQAFARLPGFSFYSYHHSRNGLVIIEKPNEHVWQLEE